jgi:hypothetical protein
MVSSSRSPVDTKIVPAVQALVPGSNADLSCGRVVVVAVVVVVDVVVVVVGADVSDDSKEEAVDGGASFGWGRRRNVEAMELCGGGIHDLT